MNGREARFVVMRHPELKRRLIHRLAPNETVGMAARAAAAQFALIKEVALVDPFTGDRLQPNRQCPPGEYNLEYE